MKRRISRFTLSVIIPILVVGISYRVYAQSVNNKIKTEKTLPNQEFELAISQNGFSYSSKDSLYTDRRNLKSQNHSDIPDFVDITQSTPKEYIYTKAGLSENEKQRIRLMLRRSNFISIPSDLKIRNIWFMRNYYSQQISIKDSCLCHSVVWDGIYPDIGNNSYISQHRRFVVMFNQVCDTIRSILSKKEEIVRLYKSDPAKSPIYSEKVTLKEIGFPIKQSKNIGKYRWSVVCSD